VALGLLIDKAEGTAVVALAQTIKQGLAEGQPKPIVRILLQFNDMDLARGIFDLQTQVFLPHQHLEINQISGPHPVDAEEAITRLKTQLLSNRTRFNADHNSGLGESIGRRSPWII
jgi:hypothetical protein